jgi:hypothetical protein
MRILLVVVGLPVLVTALVSQVAAAGHRVAYTWTVTVLGPLHGGHGGGPLFSDGTGAGKVALSFPDEGHIFHFEVVGWSHFVPGESIDVCFTTRGIKGVPDSDSLTCSSQETGPLEVTGRPAFMDLTGDGHPEIMFRVTAID